MYMSIRCECMHRLGKIVYMSQQMCISIETRPQHSANICLEYLNVFGHHSNDKLV